MTDRFRDRLSEFLDGELKPDEHRLVERHLEQCDECAQTLDQLRAVVERAQLVTDREPENDLWPAIAGRLGEKDTTLISPLRPRRIAFSVPQLAAAAVVLASVSAGAAWLAGAGPTTGSVPAGSDGPAQLVSSQSGASRNAELYAASIAQLERALFDRDRPLPPQTEARVRRALVTIDRAIEDARQALLEVPDDPYLQDHMTNTMQRKSEFLERAVRLAARS